MICYLCHDFSTQGTADACRRCLALLDTTLAEILGRSTAQDNDDDQAELDPRVECGPFNPEKALYAPRSDQ